MLPSFDYARPTTIKDAVAGLSTGDSRILAGGTDLVGCLRDRVFPISKVVSLGRVPDLRGISETPEGGLRIGALTSIETIARSPSVRSRYAALAEAAASVGSPQLRRQGTLGGNLCQKPRCWYYRGDFPCLRKGGEVCFAAGGESEYHCIFGGSGCYIVHPSDTAPALVALGATVEVVGPARTRAIDLGAFFVGPSVDPRRETVLEPGEILTRIVLPAPGSGGRSSYRKVRARAAWDFALVGVALKIRFTGGVVREARVVLSGVAPVPWRARGAEKALVGHAMDAATIRTASQAATEGALPLANNAYKVPLLRGLMQERLEAIAEA